MAWRITGLDQPAGWYAEHHQTLQRAQAHRLVDDENPIVAPRQRAPQHGQAQPTAPIQDGGRRRPAQREVACQQAQHPTDPATPETGMQVQLHAELDHLQAMMMVGNARGDQRCRRLFVAFPALLGVGFTAGCVARRCLSLGRQCPRLPVGTAVLQVANPHLCRTQALLAFQRLGLPAIARAANEPQQPRNGSPQIVHACRTSAQVPATRGVAICSQIQRFSTLPMATSSHCSVLLAKHLFCRNDRWRFWGKLNYLGAYWLT